MLISQTTSKSMGKDRFDILKHMAEGGFSRFDINMCDLMKDADDPFCAIDYMDAARAVKEFAENLGLSCNQAHAPFPSNREGDSDYDVAVFGMIVRSMEIAAYLGAKCIVVHPVIKTRNSPEEWVEDNIEFYGRLLPYCKKFGIKIATENMFSRDRMRGYIIPSVCGLADNFCRVVDSLDPEWFTACLDIGHTTFFGEPQDFIRAMGSRIGALHVHDNDYRDDRHTAPYFGRINWDEVAKALADVGYRGDFTYEVGPNYFGNFREDMLSDACAHLYKTAEKILSVYEEELVKKGE